MAAGTTSPAGASRSAGAPRAPKPPSYGGSLLLVLALIVAAEVVAGVVAPVFRGGELGLRRTLLLGLGGAAVVALVALNARWLWVTLGNLRYALALITVWAVTSMLGTLVVQRFPNQTDEGYARGFKEATGDFLYNVVHAGGGVQVRPAPDVEAWLGEQERLYGKVQGEETRKEWHAAERGRLRAAEIKAFTAEHDAALDEVLAVVSALRLPEAFQISVWFKALLALLCLSLVIVVMQRWRGEWRQVGWVMAHFGMVIFVIGASVRATSKLDGFLPMRAGETTDRFLLKVAPERFADREPGVFVNERSGDAMKIAPLDFEFTLHRFKTEYPKQLLVSFAPSEGLPEGASRNYRVSPGWTHPFLDDGLQVSVERIVENAEMAWEYREAAEGAPEPTLLAEIRADWLPGPQQVALRSAWTTLFPPDGEYRVQYAAATDGVQAEALAEPPAAQDLRGHLYRTDSDWHVEVRAGRPIALGDLELRLLDVVPDYARRGEEDAATSAPLAPAARFEVLRDGAPQGEAWVLEEGPVSDDGALLPGALAFDFDAWAGPASRHYRLLRLPDGRTELLSFRGRELLERREVSEGDELALGSGGDTLRVGGSFERPERALRFRPADTSGMTSEDVYYASLPAVLELSLSGRVLAESPTLSALASRLAEVDPPASSGLVRPADYEAGLGNFTLMPDGSLRVRLLSDRPVVQSFPSGVLGQALALPFALHWFTNDRGAPLRFTSDVSLTRDGRLLKRALVEPNKPLYLAGFQFSQADFRKDDPGYSGFGVVRDPSVRVAYAGMSILVAGVILLFYVNPMIARRRTGRGRAEYPA